MGLFREVLGFRPEKATPARVEVKWPFDVYDSIADAYPLRVSPALSAALMSGLAGSQAYDYIYSSQPSVFTVVEFLATQVSGVGMKVYRRKDQNDREEIRSGQLFDLIREPAPGITYTMWMHQWVADRCIFGNSYQRKIGTGADRALVPIPAKYVQPSGGNLWQAARYEFKPNAESAPVVIPADQMLHSRRYHPRDPRVGLSPLEPLRVMLRSEAAALSYMENVWANGARAHGWLRLPPDVELSDASIERLRASLKETYSGSAGSGKLGILEGGADFVNDSWNPQESEFIEGRKLTLETVARALNVPLAVLSLTDAATYASQSEFHKQLYVDTLGPWFKTIEEELEAVILPWLGVPDNVYVEFNVEEKLRGNFMEQVVALNKAIGVPWLAPNEGRGLQNWPRIDDEEMDRPVKPSNVVYGDAQPPGEAPMPEQRETGEGEPRLRVAGSEE